jgi:hypothetical protein
VGIVCALASILIPSASNSAPVADYFPNSAFHGLAAWDAAAPKPWSQLLGDFREPVLFNNRSFRFEIRVVVAPASSYAMLVRISETKDGVITAEMKQMPARTASPLMSQPIQVTTGELSEIKNTLARAHFWSIGNTLPVLSTDGADLLVEVKNGSGYHVVHTNVASGGPTIGITRKVLSLAHLHLPGE